MKVAANKKVFRCLMIPWIIIKYLNSVRCQIMNRILFIVHNLKCTAFPKIYGILFIRNKGNIHMGKGVTINSGLSYSPIGGNNKTVLYTTQTGNINLGNRVGISNACLFSECNITIEDNVLIGGGTHIYDTDFHSVILKNRLLAANDNDVKKSPVYIKKGAFIGAHSIVLKGVTIGENSIVGAGSVVSKNIPDNEIWAGNPVKFIKNNC